MNTAGLLFTRWPKILASMVLAYASTLFFINTSSALPSQSALKLSPVRQNIKVSPGKSVETIVHVFNPTNEEVSIRPIISDFTALDSSGTPSIFLDTDKSSVTRSFKDIASVPETVSVPARQQIKLKVNITVPKDAPAGGYYGAIRILSNDTSESAGRVIETSAASLVLLDVPGDINEDLSLTSFIAKPSGFSLLNFWVGGGSNSLDIRFKNSGDIHEAPSGQAYIKQGSEVVRKIDFNQAEPRSFILPDSSRQWKLELGELNKIGKYTIGAVFTYGEKNQTIETSQSVFVFPLAYIITGGVVLLLVVLFVSSLLIRRTPRGWRGLGGRS